MGGKPWRAHVATDRSFGATDVQSTSREATVNHGTFLIPCLPSFGNPPTDKKCGPTWKTLKRTTTGGETEGAK